MKTLRKFIFCAVALLPLAACSHSPSLPPGVEEAYEQWYAQVRAKAEPVWKPLMSAELRKENEADTLQTVFATYAVTVSITVNAEGKVLHHKVIKPSPVPAMNQIAETTIEKISPLPPPPAILLRKGRARLNWEFGVWR